MSEPLLRIRVPRGIADMVVRAMLPTERGMKHAIDYVASTPEKGAYIEYNGRRLTDDEIANWTTPAEFLAQEADHAD